MLEAVGSLVSKITSEWITAGITFFVAIFTGFSAWFSWKAVKVQTEPNIYIDLGRSPSGHFTFRLEIQNIGPVPAKNLRFDWELEREGKSQEDIELGENLLEKLTKDPPFQVGIAHMAPSEIVCCNYVNINQYREFCFFIKVKYEGDKNGRKEKPFSFNMRERWD